MVKAFSTSFRQLLSYKAVRYLSNKHDQGAFRSFRRPHAIVHTVRQELASAVA